MEQERYAFIIRIWREPATDPLDPTLQIRGSIQMAHHEEQVYFHSLEMIPQLLAQITRWSAAANNVKRET